jgi:ATP-dependent RNA helicase DDX51/DBP6
MATIAVIDEGDLGRKTKDRSKKEKKSKKGEREETKESVLRNEKEGPVGLEEVEGEPSEMEMQGWQMETLDGGSEAGSMGALSLDEGEQAKYLMEVEESSVATLEDGPTVKGASYYLAHQRVIETKELTPLEEVCEASTTPLSDFVIQNLKKLGMTQLFPVQAEVIPFVLRSGIWGGDVCVCAPTGSGKTLAYVIPIVQQLHLRSLRRLRALVLVPTHDLVVQVANVFMAMVQGTDLIVEALYGNKGFESEQHRLVPPKPLFGHLEGGSSAVDIVVSTPGRLIDHLQETPGFTLQHLQFLVLDEADRLLMHSFQDWLHKVLEAIHRPHEGAMNRPFQAATGSLFSTTRGSDALNASFKNGSNDASSFLEGSSSLPLDGTKIDAVTNRSAFLNVAVLERQYTQLQKLLFSATLTQNPEKINSLRLVNPQYFTAVSAGKSYLYTIPSTLEQNLTVCTEQHKPLLLLHLLMQYKDAQTLCFVRSIDTAHRLTLLLKFLHAEEFLNGHPIYEYSSSLTQQERNQIILKFKSGAPGVIICSDVMARGLDIDHVRAVVNYDLPFHVKTYVHRVGRTGRAGRAGTSWSIALKEEVKKFKASLTKAENATQNYIPLPYEEIKRHFARYREALRQLAIEMEREKGAAATQQSLLHASFSLPLDSPNVGDKQSIHTSLTQQVARAWFADDAHAILSPHHDSSSSAPQSAPVLSSPVPSTPQRTRQSVPSTPSIPRAKETPQTADKSKSKRRRRNKKNELDSLSLSSDSSSSDSESSDTEALKSSKQSKQPKQASSSKMEVDTKSESSKTDSRSRNRKKRKRSELDSLSLSSSSSSDSSDSSDSEKKSSKSKKRSSKSKEKHNKSRK